MALNGLWQLKKLVVRYCDWGGSSRGMRKLCLDDWPLYYGMDKDQRKFPKRTVFPMSVANIFFVHMPKPSEHYSFSHSAFKLSPNHATSWTIKVCLRVHRVSATHIQAAKSSIGSGPIIEAGKHPHLRAYYRDKTVRIDCVKNMDPEDILLRAIRLRNALGAEARKLKNRHMTKNRSVQGTWTTATRI